MKFDELALSIGKTPLIRLNRVTVPDNTIYVKTEARNPAGSIKDRVAYAMIDDAEKSGILTPGMTILEPTSGNTGIGLSAIGVSKGYKVAIVMPESMSIERRKIMTGLGAELILTEAAKGMSGAIKKTQDLLMENPGKYYMPDQFNNQANPAIHVLTTAPEIDLDMEDGLDAVVAGVGTGGTISGIGYYFKKIKNLPMKMIAVEPSKSPVISQTLAGADPKPGPHAIQGIGAGFIPGTLDLGVLDHVFTIDDDEALSTAARLMKEEGIPAGISGGAALCGALKAAKVLEMKNKKIVVILPDSGERYLSTKLFE